MPNANNAAVITAGGVICVTMSRDLNRK